MVEHEAQRVQRGQAGRHGGEPQQAVLLQSGVRRMAHHCTLPHTDTKPSRLPVLPPSPHTHTHLREIARINADHAREQDQRAAQAARAAVRLLPRPAAHAHACNDKGTRFELLHVTGRRGLSRPGGGAARRRRGTGGGRRRRQEAQHRACSAASIAVRYRGRKRRAQASSGKKASSETHLPGSGLCYRCQQ